MSSMSSLKLVLILYEFTPVFVFSLFNPVGFFLESSFLKFKDTLFCHNYFLHVRVKKIPEQRNTLKIKSSTTKYVIHIINVINVSHMIDTYF